MKNAEWMIQNGYKFINLRAFDADNANRAYKIGLRMEDYTWKWIGEVNKVYNDRSTAVFTWLDMEHVEPILDDEERAYLSAVIKPFRDRVEFITKEGVDDVSEYAYCYISISFTDGNNNMDFPAFRARGMYTGMVSSKRYTLEELGL